MPCHRPGEAGPFSFLRYADVHKRASQIARVTKARFMPPWPPEPGYGDLAGSRRLTDEQVALIQRWAAEGAPEGPPSTPPPLPAFTEGWQLGPPDLVIELPEPYTVPAEGTDVFRNFVVRAPVHGPRYVRAMELRPGDKRVVHHANVLLDRSGSARRRDAKDPGPGFAGMDVELESDAFEPDSHFLFWKPGTAAITEPEGMAWTIDERTDLVLNLHLQPSGKPETIRPVVGLYFTETAPTRFPMLLQLEHDGAIDIPPGAPDFVVTDEYTLPVDAEVLAVYPHAHYVGKDVQGFATLPDGTRTWLIWIRDWDFAWQAVYPLAHPVFLPRGSVLHLRIAYDNSEGNVRNPSHPPKRVVRATGRRTRWAISGCRSCRASATTAGPCRKPSCAGGSRSIPATSSPTPTSAPPWRRAAVPRRRSRNIGRHCAPARRARPCTTTSERPCRRRATSMPPSPNTSRRCGRSRTIRAHDTTSAARSS